MTKTIVKNTVTQSNHLVKSAYALSLNEKRLLMLAISKINPKKWEQDWEIEITSDDWDNVYCRGKHSYEDLKAATDSLKKQEIEFQSGPDTVEGGHWVSWATYYPGEGRVTLEFPRKLRKYLAFTMLVDEGFTSYKLIAAGKLRSIHSIRLYEFLLQFKSTSALIITIDDLKYRLCIGDRYKLFSDLRKWVIQKAIDDINKNSDYFVSWEVHEKSGRKVNSLKFLISEKKQKTFDFKMPTKQKVA